MSAPADQSRLVPRASREGSIDRDALEAIADLHLATGAGWKDEGRAGFIEHVRAILAKVGRPTIDRGALLELLSDETGWEWDGEQDEPAPIFGCDTRVPSSRQSLEAFADRILALVRPVEGITLSHEEAKAMQAALAVSLETEPWSEPIASTLRALASRLEASA